MDLAVLQTVRLKGGMAEASTIAELTGKDEAAVQAALDEAATAEQVMERRGRYRLMPPGREVLTAALAEERAGLDTAALETIWSEYHQHDSELKDICLAWQQRDGEPNDHSDPAYDAQVFERIGTLHSQVAPLATRIAEISPRLGSYPGRLDAAYARVKEGEGKFVANPMVDSYHQVFHELHEELYDATGKDRATEESGDR